MTPSRGHLAYQESRVVEAHRMYRVARVQRLGATVIKRREAKWKLEVAELAKLRRAA